MTSMTVKEFALELKLPVKTLLAQLRAAGVPKDAENDVLSDADKSRLLDSLRIERTQTSQRKITINRKEKSVIKQTDASGRAHTIQVEVRKKRVFMKNPQIQAEEEAKIEQLVKKPFAAKQKPSVRPKKKPAARPRKNAAQLKKQPAANAKKLNAALPLNVRPKPSVSLRKPRLVKRPLRSRPTRLRLRLPAVKPKKPSSTLKLRRLRLPVWKPMPSVVTMLAGRPKKKPAASAK